MGVLEIVAVGALCILSFVVGAKIGQTIVKGEKVNLPNLNPVKAIEEYREDYRNKKQAEKEQERIDTIMRNIEGYDGTSRGQEDVPRG